MDSFNSVEEIPLAGGALLFVIVLVLAAGGVMVFFRLRRRQFRLRREPKVNLAKQLVDLKAKLEALEKRMSNLEVDFSVPISPAVVKGPLKEEKVKRQGLGSVTIDKQASLPSQLLKDALEDDFGPQIISSSSDRKHVAAGETMQYAAIADDDGSFRLADLTQSIEYDTLYAIRRVSSLEASVLLHPNFDRFRTAINTPQRYLAPVCDYANDPSATHTQIEMESPGTAELENQRWHIRKKLKVSFR